MRVGFAIIVLATSLLVGAAPAQEQARPPQWQRKLAEMPELIELVQSLREGLESDNLASVGAQLPEGKVGLLIRSQGLPLGLYGRRQALAILADYLADRDLHNLQVGMTRIESHDRAVHVALDLPSGRQLGGRPDQERFVASYRLGASGWRLSGLRCP